MSQSHVLGGYILAPRNLSKILHSYFPPKARPIAADPGSAVGRGQSPQCQGLEPSHPTIFVPTPTKSVHVTSH